MNAKKEQLEFIENVKKVVLDSGFKKTERFHFENYFENETKFGRLGVNVLEDNSILFSIYLRFGSDFKMNEFKKCFPNSGINKYSHKWNIHEEKKEDAIQVLKMRLQKM